ncbi:MAG TPA: hypothetical protein VGZ32_13710 [Actinocrinis sp.]|nr:hypothetical protein [Actinocrinis sp.]HEV3171402.1 hypothetical protein [Actinocrinis sp.]
MADALPGPVGVGRVEGEAVCDGLGEWLGVRDAWGDEASVG